MTARTADRKDTSPSKKQPASPDIRIKNNKTEKAELSEDELKDVTGGCCSGNHMTV